MDSQAEWRKTEAFRTTLIYGKPLADIPGIDDYTARLLSAKGFYTPETVLDYCRKTLALDGVRCINWLTSFGIPKENAKIAFMALHGYSKNESGILAILAMNPEPC